MGGGGAEGHPPPTNYHLERNAQNGNLDSTLLLLAGSFNTPWGPIGDQKRRNPKNGIRKLWLKIKNPKCGLDYEENSHLNSAVSSHTSLSLHRIAFGPSARSFIIFECFLHFRPIFHCPCISCLRGQRFLFSHV